MLFSKGITSSEILTEKALEDETIKQLKALNYEEVTIKTQADLKQNFKQQFLKYNLDNKIDQNLTDCQQLDKDWFDDLMAEIARTRKVKDVLDTYRILRTNHAVKSRKPKQIFLLKLFDQKDWCKNFFQVARQVPISDSENNFRYDLVLLINGLPLVLLELKKRGNKLKEARQQIKKYAETFQILYRYIEILIVSNGTDTEYFANQPNFKSNIVYHQWANNINCTPITELGEFVNSFLTPCRLAKIIARYIFIHEQKKLLLIMYPHQIYAVESLLKLAEGSNNNGYIQHTTGSGKTFTAFALCDLLQREGEGHQVFFLTDRKELDLQSFEEFDSFKKDSVVKIEKTFDLALYFKNPTTGKIVATSIHKMNRLINKSSNQNLSEKFEGKIFFIIDECHRTQSGEMHNNLKKNFPQARFFGFTGTPIFPEETSNNEKSTTELFGERKHSYTMYQALTAKNKCILPFCIRYVPFFSNKEETEKVQWIIDHHRQISQNKNYNALLVTQNIEHLLKYYRLFKDRKNSHSFKIAAIFSSNKNLRESSNFSDDKNLEKLESIIKEYNEEYKQNATSDNYHQLILKDMKDFNNIDILIVVKMFLTGFDSPFCNTLYVDRFLQKHELFQAFSRTIRKHNKEKTSGNIICFQTTEKEVDKSLNLFAVDEKSKDWKAKLLTPTLEEKKAKLNEAIKKLKTITATPKKVDDIIGNLDQEKNFHRLFIR